MRTKKLFAGVLAGAMVVGCMAMPTGAASSTYDAVVYTGSFEITDETGSYWTETVVTLATLIGDTNPDDVTEIDFSCADGNFYVGYNQTSGDWIDSNTLGYLDSYAISDMTLADGEMGGPLKLAISVGSPATYTIEWEVCATVYDDVLTYSLSDTELKAKSYTVILVNSDGATATITGNTYVADGSSNYIEIDLSEIPESQSVSIQSVDFTY